MADPLRITFVSTPHWGRATGREVEVPDGLVVFYGPNEVGKSSFATAIALLLAGPGTRDDLHRLGEPGDVLNGRLTAKLGDGDLSVEVTTKVPRGTGSATDKETVIADLAGTALNRADLSVWLGGITLENYRNSYWVSAEEIFIFDIDEKEKHGGLSSRAIFGKLDPFELGSDLKEEGFNQTGKPRGKAKEGSARFHAEKLPELAIRVREAESSRGSWQGANSRHQQAIGKQQTASEALKACDDEIGQLERAITAVNLHLVLETAEDDLRSTTEPTDVNRDLYANRESIGREIGELERDRATLATAETERRRAADQAGDWADLPAGVDTMEDTIDGVQTEEGTIRSARGKYREAEVDEEVRADAERRIPTEDRPRGVRFTPQATAVGLVVAALVLAVSGQGIPAAILGVAGAALLWRLRDGQSAKSGPGSRKDPNGDLIEKRALLKTAIRSRDKILLAAGIPGESIPADNDRLATRLRALANLQRAREDYDRYQTDVTTREATLLAYFPEGTQVSETNTLLLGAKMSVEARETAKEEVADAQGELHQALGGRETPEEEMLKANDRASLQALLETASSGRRDLETRVVDADAAVDAAGMDLYKAEHDADLQTPLLELEAVNDIVREQAVDGLAHLLAADLLVSSATAYQGDHQPELLSVANRVATEISDSWTRIRFDPHSDQLRVGSINGEHSDDRLSTGGRSLLNLALRLGGITVASEKLPVRLPVILDDALANLDADRRRTAFQVLTEFAKGQQVLYFTCHKHHADAATEAGASVINF